jgi:hypothetical protein
MLRSKVPILLALLLIAGVPPKTRAAPPAGMDLYGDPLPAGAAVRLGTVRFRSPDWGGSLAFLPDGKTLVAAGDRRLLFWDAASGRLRQIDTGGQYVGTLALSPDGKHIAAASSLHGEGNQPDLAVLRVFETAGGKEVRAFRRTDSNEDVQCLAFLPDGKTLAVGRALGAAGDLTLWDLATRRPLWRVESLGRVRALAWTTDGKTLFVGGGPQAALVDAGDGKVRRTLPASTRTRYGKCPWTFTSASKPGMRCSRISGLRASPATRGRSGSGPAFPPRRLPGHQLPRVPPAIA